MAQCLGQNESVHPVGVKNGGRGRGGGGGGGVGWGGGIFLEG